MTTRGWPTFKDIDTFSTRDDKKNFPITGLTVFFSCDIVMHYRLFSLVGGGILIELCSHKKGAEWKSIQLTLSNNYEATSSGH